MRISLRLYLIGIFLTLVAVLSTAAKAEVPFTESDSGDLMVPVLKLSKNHIKQLRRDIPGNQGKCVEFMIVDYQQYESDVNMIIPAERHGIEFIFVDNEKPTIICTRFTEDIFDYEGNLSSSLEYEKIDGY